MADTHHHEGVKNWSQSALGLQLISRRCWRFVQRQDESSEGLSVLTVKRHCHHCAMSHCLMLELPPRSIIWHQPKAAVLSSWEGNQFFWIWSSLGFFDTTNNVVGRLGGVMVCVSDSWSIGHGFDSRPVHRQATTLGKLLTPMCLCHQAVQFGTGQRAVMLCGQEGNHRSSIALAMRHRL